MSRSKGAHKMQMGLFEIPSDMDLGVPVDDDSGNDSDLEAELQALSSGGAPRARRRPPPREGAVPPGQLDAMVAASLRDEPDDDIEVDENDPELLSELNEITGDDENEEEPSTASPVSQPADDAGAILAARLQMYEQAQKHAESIGESSRARRYKRAIKTIKDMIKHEKSGRPVDMSELPPEVSVTLGKHQPPPVADDSNLQPPSPASPETPRFPVPMEEEPPVTPSGESAATKEALEELRAQYRVAAVRAKRSGDSAIALEHVKTIKRLEMMIAAVDNGQSFDLTTLPPPPPSPEVSETSTPSEPPTEQAEVQQGSPSDDGPAEQEEEAGLVTAASVGEALQQRLEFFTKQEAQAKEEGNASKARRLGRVVKQFQQAVKAEKTGKPVDFEALPQPPGFAPIPIPGGAPAATSQPARPAPAPEAPNEEKASSTRVEKQVALLLAKQKEFKMAALKAKRNGEINEAKEYLRQAKGFDKLIEMARGGLRIDLASLPVSPTQKSKLNEEYNIKSSSSGSGGSADMLRRLEEQLTRQLKMCLNTRDHSKAIGDVAAANRFERLAVVVTADLDVVRAAKQSGTVPRFHYEQREFSIVKTFTELGDNDVQVSVLRGINLPASDPDELDTYVKFEFPWPQDSHFSDKTSTVKGTNNPDYNTTLTVPINRKARNCQRIFKRHSAKFEVYSKGGWFRGDSLLGTANVKLTPLETECEIHDSFDLAEGRKKVGGKLEIRLRVRQPIAGQQMEQVSEKWLVVDH